MSTIFLWLGLTLLLASKEILGALNAAANVKTFELLGALSMVIGVILLLVKK